MNAQAAEARLRWLDGSSPHALVTGVVDETLLALAARLLLRYTRAELNQECSVQVIRDVTETSVTIRNDWDETFLESLRI